MRIFLENLLTDPGEKQEVEVEVGSTLGELVYKLKCEDLNVVIGGSLVPHSYVLKEDDEVTLFTVLMGG